MTCPHEQPRETIESFHEFRCAMCGYAIAADSITNTDPECPELVRLHSPWAPFVGIVQGEDGDPATLLVLCSRRCAEQLVRR